MKKCIDLEYGQLKFCSEKKNFFLWWKNVINFSHILYGFIDYR